MKRRYSLQEFNKNAVKAITFGMAENTVLEKLLQKSTPEDDLRALRELRYLNLSTDGKKA
jgi:hypothetical protein